MAGGGTAGHVLPALAVARALSAAHGEGSVELVGSRRGLDSDLVSDSGIPVTLLPGRGLSRRRNARALAQNLGSIAQLALAGVMAAVLVLRRRPEVVVAMGGYASVPASLAAVLVGVPVVLVNVDAVPGAANRLLARFATAAAVAFEGTPLPRAVLTGAPVREEILRASRPDVSTRLSAREELGIPPGRSVVGVVGGSLGARRLNEAVLGLVRLWEKRSDIALFHVVGNRDARWAAGSKPELPAGGLWYEQVPYEHRMPMFYEAADVVVCRAGANTVAELTVVGIPSLIVPLPGSPGDHQSANASVLESAGASVVVKDEDCSSDRLSFELDRMLGDRQGLEQMRGAAEQLGRRDALERVVSVVETNAGRKSPHRPRLRSALLARHPRPPAREP